VIINNINYNIINNSFTCKLLFNTFCNKNLNNGIISLYFKINHIHNVPTSKFKCKKQNLFPLYERKKKVIYYYITFCQTFMRVMKSRGFNKPRKQMHHIFHSDVISFSMFIKITRKIFYLLTFRNIIPFVKI